MTSSDRFYLWAGVIVTTTPSGSATARLSIEGTLNGNYDSRVVIPLPVTAPQITGVSPPSGEIGTAVTIGGSGFGATQGGSVVTFNGTPATATSWSAGSIGTSVPFGATTGPAVVTVSGVASNGAAFTVLAGVISGVITKSADGSGVSGAIVEAMQSGSVKWSTTSGAGGSYTLSGLAAGTYDVRVSASGLATSVNSGVVVTTGSTTTLNVSMAPSPPISYVYDEAGRLTGASDPNSDSARYSYDATGNLLSIARQSSSQVSILEFSPDRGMAGTVVAISGTGLSPTPNLNTVRFNGVTAVVASSSATKIVATVPAGATTGAISVTAPAGTASSSEAFTIPADVAAEITPGGPPVTVTIPTPGQNARVRITGATLGQRVSVVMSGITIAESDVSMLKPDGTTLAGPQLVTPQQLGFLDVQTLNLPGEYAIVIDPRGASIGSIRLVARTPSDVTGPITTDGQPLILNITDPGQNARLAFTGVAGHKVNLQIDNISIAASDLSILTPAGGILAGPAYATLQDVFLFDGVTIPESGTYTILVDPRGANTGRMRLWLNQCLDITGTIQPGGPPVAATIAIPGQNFVLTFGGVAGQHVSLTGWMSEPGMGLIADFKLLKPDATPLVSSYAQISRCSYTVCYGYTFLEATLPDNGQYTVLFDPRGGILPDLRVTLYNVPADLTGSVTINGPAVPVAITIPGQEAVLGFGGGAGQAATVRITGNTFTNQDGTACGPIVSLLAPSGSLLTSLYSAAAAFDLPAQTLPVNGDYTIRLNPLSACTGSVNVSVTSP